MRTEQVRIEQVRRFQFNSKAHYLKKKFEPYLYLIPTVISMFILLVIPIFMVIRDSFYNNVIIDKQPVFVGFENFREILTDTTFLVAVKNTLIFVGGSVIVHLILGMTFAILLNTKYFSTKTKSLFRVIFALPWMFTAAIIAILWKLLLDPNGVINYLLSALHLNSNQIDWLSSSHLALLSVTIINIWAGYPFYMMSILAALQGVPSELYESSAVDGANKVQEFFRITIPQLKPILISLVMLDFIWTIQQFTLVWMTTGGGPINATQILSTFIYEQAFNNFQYSQASASAVILLVVCSIVAIFYVRHQRGQE